MLGSFPVLVRCQSQSGGTDACLPVLCNSLAAGQKIDRVKLQTALKQIGFHLQEVGGSCGTVGPPLLGEHFNPAFQLPAFQQICSLKHCYSRSCHRRWGLQEEVGELFAVVDVEQRGEVTQAELAAGLIDWKAFQDTYKSRWLECARRVFAELDSDGTGDLSAQEIAGAFSSHLSQYEVRGTGLPWFACSGLPWPGLPWLALACPALACPGLP